MQATISTLRIKHGGSLLKRIRSELEPALYTTGFVFDGKCKPGPGPDSWRLDYLCSAIMLSLIYNCHTGQLIAETIDEKNEYCAVAIVSWGMIQTSNELLIKVASFTSAVHQFLDRLPSGATTNDSK